MIEVSSKVSRLQEKADKIQKQIQIIWYAQALDAENMQFSDLNHLIRILNEAVCTGKVQR